MHQGQRQETHRKAGNAFRERYYGIQTLAADFALLGWAVERAVQRSRTRSHLRTSATGIAPDTTKEPSGTRMAVCEMRCSQLGLPLDSQETTTCVRCAPSRRLCFGCGPWSHSLWVIPRSFLSRRACNIRKRTQPPLGAGYCANGVVQVFTALTVRELISSSPSAVAQVGSHPVPVVCKYV